MFIYSPIPLSSIFLFQISPPIINNDTAEYNVFSILHYILDIPYKNDK